MVEIAGEINREHLDKKKAADFYAEGGKRAIAFIMDVVKKHKHHGAKYSVFDENLLIEINKATLWYAHPDAKGRVREEEFGTEVDGEPVVGGMILRRNFHRFGKWLADSVAELPNHSEDLLWALNLAAAAHYGLTGPQLHPFVDGNGRTARALINGILMLGTKELMEYGHAVPPVPFLRQHKTVKGRIDPYVIALRNVGKESRLNPLEKFIAERWANNLGERLKEIEEHIKKPRRKDTEMILKFEIRRDILLDFIKKEDEGKNENHPIPDYFSSRWY